MHAHQANKATRHQIKPVYGILLIALLALSFRVNAQQPDTAKFTSIHSPNKASIMSACLPGLGQAYNKKYWKIPVIYAGVAAITYFAILNTDSLRNYSNEYQLRLNGDTSKYLNYGDDDLLTLKNYYRRNLELTYVAAFGLYILNIVDAAVDAHLFEFDINDQLSMKVSPVCYPYQKSAITGLSFSFKIGNNKPQSILRN